MDPQDAEQTHMNQTDQSEDNDQVTASDVSPKTPSADMMPKRTMPSYESLRPFIAGIIIILMIAAGAYYMIQRDAQNQSENESDMMQEQMIDNESDDTMEPQDSNTTPTIDPSLSQEEQEIEAIDLGDIDETFQNVESDIDSL